MTTMNEQSLKSSKFTIDNDRSNGSKLPEPIDDEIEEGEASPDEEGSPDREASPDIVKFNIIVGNAKQDIPNYGQRNEQFPTKNSISHSSSRSREFSFYRPPAVRDRLGPKGKYKSDHESESQRSLKPRSPVLEKEDIGLDFGPEEFEPSQSMLEERAKRFGIHLSVTKKQIQDLYKSLDISEDDFRRGGWRAEAIHVRGVEGLGSAEVFKYFKKYSPHSIEWHNKSSCNIVWLEKEQATKALLGLSCPIKPSKILKTSTKLRSKKPVKNKEVKAAKPSLAIKSEGKEKKKSKKSSSNDSSSSSSDSSSSSSSSESEDEDGSSSDSSSSSSSSSGSSSSGSSSSSSSSSDSEDEENSKEQPAAATAVAGHQQVPVFEANNNNSNNNDESPSEMEVDDPPLETRVPEEMEGSVSAEDIGVPIPPGRWRLGVPCPHTKAILMRFAHAHCKDKKLSGMERPIELYQDFVSKKIKREFPREKKPERSYAKSPRVPRSYMDGTLRPLPVEPSFGRPREDWVEKPPPPMGRQYKDLDDPIDENKNPWGFLAQNWGRKETQDNLDYKDLLLQHVTGQKRKRAPSDSEGEEEEEEEEEERRFQRPIRPSQRLGRDRHKRHRVQYDPEYRYVDLDARDDVEEEEEEEEEDVVAWRSKIKLPMMRMYADAEEKKKKKRQKKPRGIESRLGSGRPSWKENPRPVSASGDLRAKLERRKRIGT